MNGSSLSDSGDDSLSIELSSGKYNYKSLIPFFLFYYDRLYRFKIALETPDSYYKNCKPI
jgi:hypothetical protein